MYTLKIVVISYFYNINSQTCLVLLRTFALLFIHVYHDRCVFCTSDFSTKVIYTIIGQNPYILGKNPLLLLK